MAAPVYHTRRSRPPSAPSPWATPSTQA